MERQWSPVKGFIVNTVVRHVKKMVPVYNIPGSVSFKKAMKVGANKKYKRPTDIGLEDVAVLQYTGVTTVVAKGAMLTHGNLIANLIQADTYIGDAFDKYEELNEQPVIMTALPLYHIFSFTVCGMYGLRKGGINSLVPNPRDGKSLLKAYKDYPPAFFPAVNTLFNGLINSEAFLALIMAKQRCLSLRHGCINRHCCQMEERDWQRYRSRLWFIRNLTGCFSQPYGSR